MSLDNPWVGYITRSYNQIKNSVLVKLGAKTPEVTDHSESNILIIIVSIFAGIAEQLNYYIDNMARESFISTARRFSSIVKLVKLIDYRIKAASPASVDMLMSFTDTNNDPASTTAPYTILKGTQFSTDNRINFLSTIDTVVEVGSTSVKVPLEQKTEVLGEGLGTTSGLADQAVSLGTDYVDNSLTLTIDGVLWERKNTLGLSTPTDQHYIVEISVDKIAYIKFGDGINGAIPTAGQSIVGDYFTTLGEKGMVDANTITTLDTALTIPGIDNIRVNNTLGTVAGYGYEDVERIRRSAPLSLRTLDRAVTRQDYNDIALLAIGVDKASAHFDCGKTVDVYISPIGGGIAQTALLTSTCNFIEERKMITTFLQCLPAGETELIIRVDVTARFRVDGIQTESDVRGALLNEYNFDSSDINRKIRKSDIIALVDNLQKVDYLELTTIYTKPFARPNDHSELLNWDTTIKEGSISILQWRLKYDGIKFLLFRGDEFIMNIPLSNLVQTPDDEIELTINPGLYIPGMEWDFKTYPIDENQEIDDFSVPVLLDKNLMIGVEEQLTINS